MLKTSNALDTVIEDSLSGSSYNSDPESSSNSDPESSSNQNSESSDSEEVIVVKVKNENKS